MGKKRKTGVKKFEENKTFMVLAKKQTILVFIYTWW
jgi:hypothetical protein